MSSSLEVIITAKWFLESLQALIGNKCKHSPILLPVVPSMLTNHEYSVLSRMILYFYAKKIPHVSVPAHTSTSTLCLNREV